MRVFVFIALFCPATAVFAQQPAAPLPSDEDLTIQAFLQAVEQSISTTNRAAWLELLSANADRDAAIEFFDSMVPQGVTRAVVRERDRTELMGTLPGDGYRLMTEVFIETGTRGRILTWKLDIRKPRAVVERQPWRLISHERLSFVEGLHRLTLHPGKQFLARDLVIKSIDLQLRLPVGDVFVAETSEGITALVMVGEGMMTFAPGPAEERGQLKIFSGGESLETPFSAAFIRINPYEFEQQQLRNMLTPAPVDSRAFRRAQLMFEEDVARSFSLDLSDLSRDTWSLLPQAGDFIAEVRTRRFDTLTFARSSGEPEDVTLFHRARKKNIAAYASPSKLSSRGRFYNEDDLVEYDIQHYDIDVTFIPERSWLEGRARLRLRVKAYALGALTLKLHEQLTVRSIESDELGRLLFLRVRNQNSVVVNMPSAVGRDMELTLSVAYQGPMRTQTLDQESLDLQEGQLQSDDLPMIPGEPNWLFSNRSYWYPQGQVTDYATSTVRVTVPAGFGAAATGTPASGMAMPPIPASGASSRITYTFVAQQPARYIGLVVSKLMHVDSSRVTLPLASKGKTAAAPEELTYVGAGVLVPPRKPVAAIAELGARNTLQLSVSANRRQLQRGRDAIGTATEIVQFYSSIVGDAPYDSLGIAMVENSLPGGHSPAYMVMLNNPTPLRSPYTWRNDPAAFSHFPEFYLAHEVAHQWWGQAVGWQNYHEQWISEGFAQYFAALYARERRGEPAFRELLKQFRRWAIDQSDQGPIYLGYRLGHLKNDGRAFRAVIYNKSAGVLHMLRRLLGDEVFFAGLRRFYADYRFKKAGTDDFRRAMEAVSGHSLERFFQRWIFESGVPRVRYSTAIEGQELVVRFEQANGEPDVLFDLPVTVSISYADKTVDEIVPLNAATVEKRIPLSGAVRSIDVNTDNAAIATFERR